MAMQNLIERAAAVAVANYAADEHPYNEPGRPETHCEYNRGWHDACDHIEFQLDSMDGASHKLGVPEKNYVQWCNSDNKPVGEPLWLGYRCPFCGNDGIQKYCPECGAKMDWEKLKEGDQQ